MINVYVRAIDHVEEQDFETLEEAFPYINDYLGDTFDIGSSYAVNAYGDVTITLEGASWDSYLELRKEMKRREYD